MPFSTTIMEPVELILRRRVQLVELLVKHNLYQAEAPEIRIRELRKHGSKYFTFVPALKRMESANGVYIFVVRSWEPWRIVCANKEHEAVDGHTSLARDYQHLIGSVYFAGEMIFRHGFLEAWNNGSGHYLPEAELASKNLLPHVAKMLPIELFRPATSGRAFGYDSVIDYGG